MGIAQNSVMLSQSLCTWAFSSRNQPDAVRARPMTSERRCMALIAHGGEGHLWKPDFCPDFWVDIRSAQTTLVAEAAPFHLGEHHDVRRCRLDRCVDGIHSSGIVPTNTDHV